MREVEKNEIQRLNDRVKALEEQIYFLKGNAAIRSSGHPPKPLEEELTELRAGLQELTGRPKPEAGVSAFASRPPDYQLHWNNWWRTDGCRDWMDVTTFAGASYTDIFYRAMRLVFFDEGNNPGLLYQGALFPHAQAVVAWNGGRMNGFDNGDLTGMLQNGTFIRYMDQFINGRLYKWDLWFAGPDEGDHGIYAKARQPGTVIYFNFYTHVQVAQSLSFPQDATGVDQLVWVTAATVLHEVMHNQGYGHPDGVDYAAGSDYASTLPFVAEQAVLRASPYWGTFQTYYSTGVWLRPTLPRTCGTHW